MPELTELEALIIEALWEHDRLPHVIQRYLHHTHPISITIEEIEAALLSLESKGVVRR